MIDRNTPLLPPENPLLDFSGLPRFADIRPEHVGPAVDTLLARNRALVAQLGQLAEAPGWDNFVTPLDDANEQLSRAWGQVSHLNAVMNTPELREVYNANLPRLTQYYTELGQDAALYGRFKALRASPGFDAAARERVRWVDNELRDFRLSGVQLPLTERERFKSLREALDRVAARFSDNVLDATDAFSHRVTDPQELVGLPQDARDAARASAQEKSLDGYRFTLHMPSYLPVLQYAENRALRETLYRAYVTRAAEFGPTALDNTPLIGEILAARAESAHLLGFASYAELSLEPKMARTPAEVLGFLEGLAERAKPFARKDWAELTDFARERLHIEALESWDVAFVSERLQQERYAFSEQEVREYFPLARVREGLFGLVERLFGLHVVAAAAPAWHPEVSFHEIRDREGARVGQFYLDLFARPGKRGGAWMDDAITRRRRAQGIQTPVAYLNCNFTPPTAGRDALLRHEEVITLFHEFGHGLHHLLTQVEQRGVSGINGVEWDAVELPSQFMENFCWEWDVVSRMSGHIDTQAPLPKPLFDRMLAARNFQSGMQFVRQIEFALFDMHLHHDFDAATDTPLKLLERIRARVAVSVPPAYNRFPNNFSHIFAGGYAAGYYSYKWAEVLSADAFSLFEEVGVTDAALGRRFHAEILAVGGTRPALESFVAFRGREPSMEALLRHSGMTPAVVL